MIAIISDIHGNLPAFQSVLERIDELGIKTIYCAGDIVGYNPFPKECISLVRKRKILSCMGNHDYGVVSGDTPLFNPFAAEAVEWTRKKLNDDELEFLLNLPIKLEPEKNMLIVHGSPKNPLWEYVKPFAPKTYLSSLFDDKKILILGHTHIPMSKAFEGRLLLNPGGVGQPRDGDPRASFATLDTDRMKAKIIRVKYDIDTVAGKIKREGLPKFLGERLSMGV